MLVVIFYSISKKLIHIMKGKYCLFTYGEVFFGGSHGKESACNAGASDLLEKGTATHSSILAWRSHRQKCLAGYILWDCKESDMTERLTL